MAEQSEERIGYGCPPKHSQFQPGQSGNPRGRPKGRRNMATMVREVLDEKVSVTLNGKKRKVSSEQALLMRLREKALGGDLKAAQMLLSLRGTYLPDADAALTTTDWQAEDLEILAATGFLSMRGDADEPV